jgi:hypothetical protein
MDDSDQDAHNIAKPSALHRGLSSMDAVCGSTMSRL